MTRRVNRRTWAVITIVLMACVSPATAKVIYVDVNAPGPAHDGSSWANAYKYLQDALSDADSAAKPVEIRVAQSIYKPDQSSADPNGSGERDATFQLINDVILKGGYAGFGQPDPNARDIELYETTLSGDLGDNDIDVNQAIDLWDEPSREENSYHIVIGSGTNTTAVLDGFTVTGGTVDYGNGGGMYSNEGSPTLSNCTFYANFGISGGGLYCKGGKPVLTNCVFRVNFASGSGAGLYNDDSNPTLTRCVFSQNHSHHGCAMFNTESSLILTNCTFTGNRGHAGGGMYNQKSSLTINKCTFRSNCTSHSGGGMENYGSSLTLTNCTFIGNLSSCGTGIDSSNSSLTLTNCTFNGNRAYDDGGALLSYKSELMLTNCTFAGNTATNGNTLACNAYNQLYLSNLNLKNCILWNGGNEIWNNSGSTIAIHYSDVQGGQMGIYDPCEGVVWGIGNIDADPCFAELGYWEDPCNTPGDPWDDVWIDGDYHLKSQAGRWDANSESWVKDYVSSPCIDSANPGCPVGDEPTPNGNRRNMGAYGGTAEASKSPGNGRNIADLTNDWAVDYNDLKAFVSYWLETGDCIPADLDRNRSADFNDYRIFASQWLYKEDSVAIFIDSNTHSNLTSQIQRLKSDIINDLGVNVFIFSDNWHDIKDIKDILIDKYNHDGLIGAIFIGDIPTAYFEYQNSGSNPTDRYFQDFSDNFIDVDGDGKFEREYYMWETDVAMREIWTGRIKPPVGGSEGIALLRNYFERNHNYRTGNLTYDRKMLYYGSVSINQGGMSQDDYDDLVNQIDDYTGLYDSDDDVNSIYHDDLEMQKRMYLTELKNKYDFVFVNIHGTPIHQWLGENSPGDQCVVYYNEIKEFRPQALFSVLASCSNGDFTTENYFAGWYLFSGNSLVVQANSTVSYLTGANTVEFLEGYIPLGLGIPFGEMDKNDRNFIVTHILGDPTLTFRPKPTGDLPRLVPTRLAIDFGDVERGSIPRQYISFWNGGTAILEIIYKKPCFSINGEHPNLGYWDFFYYEHPNSGETFRDLEVRPGKCKVVPFYFYPRADGPIGRYTMTILFQTNDPEFPYMEIHLSGNAI